MPAITLPDGSQKHFDQPVSVAEVAASIGPGLAKAALAGKVNGKLVDTSASIDQDATLSIVTDKDPEGLEIIRHSTAHLLANAVQELFPDAQVTIGPVIENGFYYDFAYKRPFSTEDLAAIEKRMAEISAKDLKVHRRVLPRDEAIAHFKKIGEHYKAEIIAAIPPGRIDQPVWPGRLGGPVPRTACPQHRQAQGVQTDESGRRLLARRFAQRNAAADLRHRLGERKAAQGIPDSLGRGGEARSSAHRQGTGPVPFAGRGAGRGVLASRRAGRCFNS